MGPLVDESYTDESCVMYVTLALVPPLPPPYFQFSFVLISSLVPPRIRMSSGTKGLLDEGLVTWHPPKDAADGLILAGARRRRDVYVYVTFRLIFHHFDRFELDLRGHITIHGRRALPCPVCA